MFYEACIDFVENAVQSHTFSTRNLVILRSLTKSYAIQGIRLGYAISSEENIMAMRKVKVPWSVTAFAQRAGSAVISGAEGSDEFLADTRKKIKRNKVKIEDWLRERDMHVESDANFYVLKVGPEKAKEVKRELLKQGLLVRDCTSFGLPSHIRFSVRQEEENERLMDALSMLNKQWKNPKYNALMREERLKITR